MLALLPAGSSSARTSVPGPFDWGTCTGPDRRGRGAGLAAVRPRDEKLELDNHDQGRRPWCLPPVELACNCELARCAFRPISNPAEDGSFTSGNALSACSGKC